MVKIDCLRKVGIWLLFGLLLGVPVRAHGQGWENGSREEFDNSGRFGGRGFGSRGGFRGGFDGGDRSSGRDWGNRDRGNRDWGNDGGGRWGGRGGFDSDDEFSFGPGGNGESAGPVSRSRERITVDLPAAFLSGDLDGDGQIGLYEWRQWKRGEMREFLALDHNQDGFLTPAELQKGPRTPLVAGSPAGSSMGSGTPGLTHPVSMNGRAESVSTSASGLAPEAARAAGTFRLLDKNRNETLEPEEWAPSRIVRTQFETAKIDITVPMTRDDFIQHFVELNPSKKP